MEIGQWVIIRNFSETMDGREWEIVGKKLSWLGETLYIVKIADTGNSWEFHADKLIKTWNPNQADYSSIIDDAIDKNDKEWFMRLTAKMKKTRSIT